MVVEQKLSLQHELVQLLNKDHRVPHTRGTMLVGYPQPDMSAGEWLAYREDSYEPVLSYDACPKHDHIVHAVTGAAVLVTQAVSMWDIDVTYGETGRKYGPAHFESNHGSGVDPARIIASLEDIESTFLDLKFRLYETVGGYRVLANQWVSPVGADYLMIANELGSDPRYTGMCGRQLRSRIRLTPKKWRPESGGEICTHLWGDEFEYDSWDKARHAAVEAVRFHDRATLDKE